MLKRGDFMESFFVALNAVLPMFIMLFIGFLVRKLKNFAGQLSASA